MFKPTATLVKKKIKNQVGVELIYTVGLRLGVRL